MKNNTEVLAIRVAMLSTSIWLLDVSLVVEILAISVSVSIRLLDLALVAEILALSIDCNSLSLGSCMLMIYIQHIYY